MTLRVTDYVLFGKEKPYALLYAVVLSEKKISAVINCDYIRLSDTKSSFRRILIKIGVAIFSFEQNNNPEQQKSNLRMSEKAARKLEFLIVCIDDIDARVAMK